MHTSIMQASVMQTSIIGNVCPKDGTCILIFNWTQIPCSSGHPSLSPPSTPKFPSTPATVCVFLFSPIHGTIVLDGRSRDTSRVTWAADCMQTGQTAGRMSRSTSNNQQLSFHYRRPDGGKNVFIGKIEIYKHFSDRPGMVAPLCHKCTSCQ